MTFNRILQQDDSRKGAFTTVPYTFLNTKPATSVPGTPVNRVTVNPVMGTLRSTLCNKTTGYQPGHFSVNPIEHRKCTADCTTIPAYVRMIYKGQTLYSLRLEGEWPSCVGCQKFGFNTQIGLSMPILADHALQGATGKVSKSTAMSLVTVSEFSKTLAMVINPVKTLTSVLGKMLKGIKSSRHRPRSARQSAQYVVDAITNAWLTYRYGVMPTIYDCEDYKKAYEKQLEAASLTILRKTRKLDMPATSEVGNPTWSNINYCLLESSYKYTSTAFVTSSVYYRRQIAESWQDVLGLGLHDVVGAGWELIPFSFVVDWFIDLGGWIEAVRPKPGIIVLGNTVGFKVQNVFERTYHRAAHYTTGPFTPISGSYRMKQEGYVRLINQPVPAMPLPGSGLNLVRTWDSLALSYQMLGNTLNKLLKR